MAEFEIASLFESLSADSQRCTPVTASSIRRRGDRRRVAVRTVAASSTVVLVGATAGTAVAVGHSAGRASLNTTATAADHHPSRSPRPSPSPSPVPSQYPATGHERVLIHKIHVAKKRLHSELAERVRLHERHRAGDVGDRRFQERLAQLNSRIAATREHIASLRARLKREEAQHPVKRPGAESTAVPGRDGTQCKEGSSTGSAAPTPMPTIIACEPEGSTGSATSVPSASPTSG